MPFSQGHLNKFLLLLISSTFAISRFGNLIGPNNRRFPVFSRSLTTKNGVSHSSMHPGSGSVSAISSNCVRTVLLVFRQSFGQSFKGKDWWRAYVDGLFDHLSRSESLFPGGFGFFELLDFQQVKASTHVFVLAVRPFGLVFGVFVGIF